MPLDKQQKTHTALRLALRMAGAAEQTGGGEAAGVMGSSPQHCSCPPLPRLALTGHGAFGLCGQVDGGLSLGPPARPVPGLHRVAIGLRLPQVLDQHHALLGVFNQHLLHGPNGYCKAQACLSPTRHRGPHNTPHFGVRVQPGSGKNCSSSLGCSQHHLRVIPRPTAEVNLQEKSSVACESQITPSWQPTPLSRHVS